MVCPSLVQQDTENRIWRLRGSTDSRIEPIVTGEKQWQTDRSSVILEVARREGVGVPLEDTRKADAN